MAIAFTCPRCHGKLQAPADSKGKHCQCALCGAEIEVPEISERTPAASELVELLLNGGSETRHVVLLDEEQQEEKLQEEESEEELARSPVSRDSKRDILLEESLSSTAQDFKLLGEELRLTILLMLSEGPMRVSDICEEVALPQPNVSHHLGLLYRGGLVCRERAGQSVLYALDQERLRKISAVLRSLMPA